MARSLTCREAVLEAMLRLEARSSRTSFPLHEIVSEVARATRFQETTIRTYVVSVMCANAPVHHQNHTDDLIRVDRGQYQLSDSGRAAARSRQPTRGVEASGPSPAGDRDERVRHPLGDDAQGDWFWEGNVQSAVVAHLENQGWVVQRQADTAAREAGADIIATRGDEFLALEVKGFPSTVYARGPRSGAPKPTQPATQARAWFSHALLSALLLRDTYPRARIVLAFADSRTYRRLAERTGGSLTRLGIGVWFVEEGSAIAEVIAPEAWAEEGSK